MEEYTSDYQVAMDIDWYFLGADNCIAQFASAGGILPDIIAKNAEANQLIHEFIDSLEPSTEVIINPYIDKFSNISNRVNPAEYAYFAKRGLFSFDKTYVCPGDFDITYYRIDAPVNPITFETLPDSIKDALTKLKQEIRFQDFYQLDAGYIPWAYLFTKFYIRPLFESVPEKKKSIWSLLR